MKKIITIICLCCTVICSAQGPSLSGDVDREEQLFLEQIQKDEAEGQTSEKVKHSDAGTWHVKLSRATFLTSEKHGFANGIALQYNFEDVGLIGFYNHGKGESVMTGEKLNLQLMGLRLRKQTRGETMKLFADAGVTYGWGQVPSNTVSETSSVRNGQQQLIRFPFEAGFQLNFCDYVGAELSGFYALGSGSNFGGLRASLLIGLMR